MNEEALINELKRLLRAGVEQMKAINGDDDKCVIGSTEYCPNHSWIHEVEAILNGTPPVGDGK